MNNTLTNYLQINQIKKINKLIKVFKNELDRTTDKCEIQNISNTIQFLKLLTEEMQERGRLKFIRYDFIKIQTTNEKNIRTKIKNAKNKKLIQLEKCMRKKLKKEEEHNILELLQLEESMRMEKLNKQSTASTAILTQYNSFKSFSQTAKNANTTFPFPEFTINSFKYSNNKLPYFW